jgi:hypothetical protein
VVRIVAMDTWYVVVPGRKPIDQGGPNGHANISVGAKVKKPCRP